MPVDTRENGLEIQNPRFQLSKQNKPISGPFPLLETEIWLTGENREILVGQLSLWTECAVSQVASPPGFHFISYNKSL